MACVVAVITIALLANAPKPEPVRVWFVRATNELGETKLIFEGTNGSSREIVLLAIANTGAVVQAKRPRPFRPPVDATTVRAAEGTNFNFTLKAPSNDVLYYVMWLFHERGLRPTLWQRSRATSSDFLYAHRMPRLAVRIQPTLEEHYIPSTEIKE